jgi:predicted component of type VI protein secretion system
MAFLKIMSGALVGTKYDIDKDETTIGRLPENVIPLNEPAVSSRHCAVVRDGKKFTLRDLGSTNGTRLNEKNISESRLKPKDIITIGAVEVVFDGEDIEVDQTAVPVPAPKVEQSVPKADQAAPAKTDQSLPTPTPTSIRKRTVITMAPGTAGQAPAVGAGAPFDMRREHKGVWATVIVIIATLAVGAFGWFLYNLFSMGHGS